MVKRKLLLIVCILFIGLFVACKQENKETNVSEEKESDTCVTTGTFKGLDPYKYLNNILVSFYKYDYLFGTYICCEDGMQLEYNVEEKKEGSIQLNNITHGYLYDAKNNEFYLYSEKRIIDYYDLNGNYKINIKSHNALVKEKSNSPEEAKDIMAFKSSDFIDILAFYTNFEDAKEVGTKNILGYECKEYKISEISNYANVDFYVSFDLNLCLKCSYDYYFNDTDCNNDGETCSINAHKEHYDYEAVRIDFNPKLYNDDDFESSDLLYIGDENYKELLCIEDIVLPEDYCVIFEQSDSETTCVKRAKIICEYTSENIRNFKVYFESLGYRFDGEIDVNAEHSYYNSRYLYHNGFAGISVNIDVFKTNNTIVVRITRNEPTQASLFW